MLKKLISLALCFVLMIPAVLAAPADVLAAASSDDTSTIKSAEQLFNRSYEVSYYSDELFIGDSYDYNAELATQSFVICNRTFNLKNVEPEDYPKGLQSYLEDKGFVDFDCNDDYKRPTDEKSSAVACAHKTITDNGRKYTLLAVIPRSGTSGVEYLRNMTQGDFINDTGDFAGYRDSSKKVIDFAGEYVKKYGISGDIKVWTTGYSGGAGTDNLFAAALLRDTAAVLGDNVRLDPSNLYCYEFSPMRVATVTGDYRDKRFEYIHNVFDPGDLLANFPVYPFDSYGINYYLPEHGNKARMLELLKLYNPEKYEEYTNKDPDNFTPYKIDVKGLLKGELAMVPDSNSYLPKEQKAYLYSCITNMEHFLARWGEGSSREGFYREYQDPVKNMVYYLVHNGANNIHLDVIMDALTGTKTSVPLILSMYTTYVLDKNINSSSENVDFLLEDSFNKLSALVEDENGDPEGPLARRLVYKAFRDAFFERVSDSEGVRYELKNPTDAASRSRILKNMRLLTARLYSESLKDAMTKAGAEQEWIDKLTTEEDSRAMSLIMAVLLLGNSEQSDRISPLNSANEQLKQVATFVNNIDRFIGPHFFEIIISWLRSEDHKYDDYAPLTAAQSAGIRRVYINAPAGVKVRGTVEDAAGNTLAEFADGRIVSRSDDWIGYTTSDKGGWLRLPLEKSYKVRIDPGSALVKVRVAEYSATELREVREAVFSGQKGGGTLVLPAVQPEGDEYSLPSDVGYSMSISEKTCSSLPVTKSLSVKAGKKSLSVKWKKLTASQRKKVSNIEVRCSTVRSFKASKTVTRELANTRASLKIGKLKKGKTYYVKTRNISYHDGVKYVSKWSSVKKTKVK